MFLASSERDPMIDMSVSCQLGREWICNMIIGDQDGKSLLRNAGGQMALSLDVIKREARCQRTIFMVSNFDF